MLGYQQVSVVSLPDRVRECSRLIATSQYFTSSCALSLCHSGRESFQGASPTFLGRPRGRSLQPNCKRLAVFVCERREPNGAPGCRGKPPCLRLGGGQPKINPLFSRPPSSAQRAGSTQPWATPRVGHAIVHQSEGLREALSALQAESHDGENVGRCPTLSAVSPLD